jgi:hypothetical protein
LSPACARFLVIDIDLIWQAGDLLPTSGFTLWRLGFLQNFLILRNDHSGTVASMTVGFWLVSLQLA